MKKYLALLAITLSAPLCALAQEDGAERERIAAERTAVEKRFAESKRECNARFAVTDCVEKATRERNAALAELRRQERLLNDAERKRRAAERLREQDERLAPERLRAEEERRARAVEEQKEREARAAEKAEKRAADQARRAGEPRRSKSFSGPSGPQGEPRAPRPAKAPGVSAAEAAKNRAAYEERQREAAEHKAEVRARMARRARPPASALPVPK